MLIRNWFKCVIPIIVFGMLQGLNYLQFHGTVNFSDIVLTLGFSDFDISVDYLMMLLFRTLHFYMFYFLFGTTIYQHFCTASVYSFTRCVNRRFWFLRQTLKLAGCSFMYVLLYPAAVVLTAGITNQVKVDEASLVLLVYYVALQGIWIFCLSLLMNVVAIVAESKAAFFIVAGLQLLFPTSLLLWDGVVTVGGVEVPINLFRHLILTWHSSGGSDLLRQCMSEMERGITLNMSVLALGTVSVLTVMISVEVVQRMELLSTGVEKGM